MRKIKIVASAIIMACATQVTQAQWALTGNAGTDTVNNFVGTTDSRALKFRTNNTQRMVISNQGRVGIGTNTPATLLDVNPASGGAAVQIKSNTASAFIYMDKKNVTDNATVSYRTNGTAVWQTGTFATNNFSIRNFTTGMDVIMCNQTTNNVGIGNITPAAKLHVTHTTLTSAPAAIFETNTDSAASIALNTPFKSWRVGQNRLPGSTGLTDAFFIHDQNNNATRFFINGTNGNVGIGNTNASEKLTLTGNALISGRVGLSVVNGVTKLNIEDTHPSDAWMRMINTTKGPNISWAGVGVSGDWTLRSCSNTGVVGMQDQAGGRIGLGTTSPIVGSKVEVKGETGSSTMVFTPATGNQSWIHYGTNGDWYIRSANDAIGKVIIQDIGSAPVCIGTTQAAAGYKLSVGGKIMCEEIKVQLASNWPDYVFANDYKAMTVEQIDAFIQTHNHLPGMPSAAEVTKNGGVELGEMQRLLLEKVEELMLQNIQQQKEIESLKKLVVKN